MGVNYMTQVIMYTTNCPKCRVLESKLKDRNIVFSKVTDVEEMRKLGYLSVPKLSVDGKVMDFTEAIDWVNNI